MDGLYDYILWLGDYPFTAVPFQEVDAVILCLLVYCDLAPLFEQAKGVYLRDSRKMIDAGEVCVRRIGKPEAFIKILDAAAASRRFGELYLSGYVDIMLSEDSIQFSAVTYSCDAGWSFIAFRGTDSTLAGWKEDFMISFKRTHAQELAKQYAENRVDSDQVWYIGGHSKGANLALYAACMLAQAQLSNVKDIFLLDGPGFCPDVMDPGIVSRIEAHVTRIIPGFSVIGRLFEPNIKDTRIVRSMASGFNQHDPATWVVDHGKLAMLAQTDSASDLIKAMLDKWIGDIPREDRDVFINDIFDALGSGGAETLENLRDQGRKGFEAMVNRLKDSNEITKRILMDLSRQAVQVIFRVLFHRNDS